MSRKKFKLTAFARFFIFILLFAPVAYLGAAYYNGEDGVQKIKEVFGIGEKAPEAQSTEAPATDNEVSDEFINGKIGRLQSENKLLEEKNNELHLQIEALKKELDQAQKETEHFKAQLKAIKDAVGS